jgi:succinylglutamate desuccinylase
MEKLGSGIWQASGAVPGPHIVILGGTHGEERTGIMVVGQIRDDLSAATINLVRGTKMQLVS